MQLLQDFEQSQIKQDIPHFKSGDTVKVHCKIKEGNKERVQIFEGVVISRHNAGISSSFTVRKISHGIGVERVFPLHAPFIEKIEVPTIGKVRQSRLYYLRKLSGKKARIAAVDTRVQNSGGAPAEKSKAPVPKASPAEPETSEKPPEKTSN